MQLNKLPFIILATACCLFTLVSCSNNHKSKTVEPGDDTDKVPAYGKNQELFYRNDTLSYITYYDTVTTTGALKYLSNVTNVGLGLDFYGADLRMQESDSNRYENVYNRLKKSFTTFKKKCDVCGDSQIDRREYSNLHLVHAYYLAKDNKTDAAIAEIQHIDKEWLTYADRRADLLLGLLMQKYSRAFIENEIQKIDSLNTKRTIKIANVTLEWDDIEDNNYADYKKQICWDKYFSKMLPRLEKYGL